MKIRTIDGKELNLVPGIELRGALLRDLNLDDIDLHGSSLRDCFFNESSLRGANLTGCDLRGAVFYRADLSGADLTNAILDDECYWKETISSASTRWPAGAPTKLDDLPTEILQQNFWASTRLSEGRLASPNLMPTHEVAAEVTRARHFVPEHIKQGHLPLSAKDNETLFALLALRIFEAISIKDGDRIPEFGGILGRWLVEDTDGEVEFSPQIMYSKICLMLMALGLRFDKLIDRDTVVVSMKPMLDLEGLVRSPSFQLFLALYEDAAGYDLSTCDTIDDALHRDVSTIFTYQLLNWAEIESEPSDLKNHNPVTSLARRMQLENRPEDAILAALVGFIEFAENARIDDVDNHVPNTDDDDLDDEDLIDDDEDEEEDEEDLAESGNSFTDYENEDETDGLGVASVIFQILGVAEAEWTSEGHMKAILRPRNDVHDYLTTITEILLGSDDWDVEEFDSRPYSETHIGWPTLGLFRAFLPHPSAAAAVMDR